MATTQMIRTEPLQTQPRWTSLSGTILEGGYELQDLLEATNAEARFKVRVLGDRELESVASLFQMAEAEIERQIELWQNVRMLRHPNLSAPLGAGRLQLDGVPLAYVVLRRADEALAAVLSERSLTAGEAGEAFMSVTQALEALHLQGWVHGCVSPDLVLAVGDYIQLPGECVRKAGIAPAAETITAKYLAAESARANLTTEADLWCLGATIFEALTQKVWTEESREELGALPEPFATIALRCLETDPGTRCGLAEAVALYRGELKLPPRVRTTAKSSIVASKQEMAAAPAVQSVQPNEPAPSHSPVPIEPVAKEQPKVKLLVENTAGTAEAPKVATAVQPEIAAKPVIADTPSRATVVPASTTQALGMDGLASHLPQAAAMAALAPEADAPRATGAPDNSKTVASEPSAYTPSKSSVIVRPNGEETRRRSVGDKAEGSTRKLWIGAGLTLLLVLALIGLLWPKHQVPATGSSSNNKTTGAPGAGQASQGSAWQTHTLEPSAATSGGNTSHTGSTAHRGNTIAKSAVSPNTPEVIKPKLHPPALKAPSKPEGSTGRNVWRVVLYTYGRLPDAENRAKAINARHSGLHAEVFSPSGGGSPYLVTTTGQASRDEALQTRRRAVGVGMAHDAYIQNYSK